MSRAKRWECCCCCFCLVTKSCPTLLQRHGLQLAKLLCPWDSPGKNTGVGCHALLQGIFPTQGIEPMPPVWQAGSLQLSHQGHPKLKVPALKTALWVIRPEETELKKCLASLLPSPDTHYLLSSGITQQRKSLFQCPKRSRLLSLFAWRKQPFDKAGGLWNSHMSNDHRVTELEISRANSHSLWCKRRDCLLFPHPSWGVAPWILGYFCVLPPFWLRKGHTNLFCFDLGQFLLLIENAHIWIGLNIWKNLYPTSLENRGRHA